MSKEAMKLALEALEENHHLIEEHERSEYLAQYDRVIGALTKALAEQPAQREPAWRTDGGIPRFKPAQRTWVGLTDDEAQKTFMEHNCTISADLAGILVRAIEAKLKEKNT